MAQLVDRPTRCSSCGAPLVWARTATRRWLSLDLPGDSDSARVFLAASGRAIVVSPAKAALVRPLAAEVGTWHTLHEETCEAKSLAACR